VAGKKVQVTVPGGIRKVIQTGGSGTAGTTIAEFGSTVVTLAQLKAALGITTGKSTTGAVGALSASLVVGPGLLGGGPVSGFVPLSLLQLTPPVVWNEPLLPDDWIGSGGSSSGSGAASPLTTKGDIYVYGATNTRLPVGTDGQVLSASSAQTTGLLWTTPGSASSINTTPDTHPATPTVWDDEFEYGTALDTTGARFAGANAWSWVNQGSATGVVTQGSLALTVPPGASDNQRLVVQSTPVSGAWAFTTKMTAPSAGSYYIAGMVLYVAASGKLIVFCNTNNSAYKIEVAGYTNTTTYGGYLPVSSDLSAYTGAVANPRYFQLTYDGSVTWSFNISVSGVPGTFINVYSANVNTAFLGAAPDHIGLIADSRTVSTTAAVDWFRRTL
jgi:hypothetical protein